MPQNNRLHFTPAGRRQSPEWRTRLRRWGGGLLILLAAAGCSEDVSEEDLQGALAGTWQGTSCGQRWVLVLNQDGRELAGMVERGSPPVSEEVRGEVSSLILPAPATLTGVAGSRYEITFLSSRSLAGIYYDSEPRCNVTAAK